LWYKHELISDFWHCWVGDIGRPFGIYKKPATIIPCVLILTDPTPLKQQMSEVIWQKTASPTRHSSRRRMYSSDLHLPSNTWFLGPTRFSTKRHLDRFTSFLHSSPVCPTQRHTDNATCYMICSISMRCGLKSKRECNTSVRSYLLLLLRAARYGPFACPPVRLPSLPSLACTSPPVCPSS